MPSVRVGNKSLESTTATAREIAIISSVLMEYCKPIGEGFCEWDGPAKSPGSDDAAIALIYARLQATFPDLYQPEVLEQRRKIITCRVQSMRLELFGKLKASNKGRKSVRQGRYAHYNRLADRIEQLELAFLALRNIQGIDTVLKKEGL